MLSTTPASPAGLTVAADGHLRILPLGGVGHMGMNAMLVGVGDRFVLVDCGVRFPAAGDVGFEREVPDIALLEALGPRVEAVLLTHGHEDHIGAVPWILPFLDASTVLHAPPFARSLLRARLDERPAPHGSGTAWDPARVREYLPRERFHAGPFEVEALRVTHSIPDCCALVLRSDAGTLLHTGDWKIDPEPLDGHGFDLEAFEALGREGVDVMLSDSTNARVPGRTGSERAVGDGLRPWVEGFSGRVIVTQFASNLYRLDRLAHLAAATGRRVALFGRSFERYLQAASDFGYAPVDPALIVSAEHAARLPPDEVLVVCTGSQGEKRAALRRAANGTHRHLRIGSGDRVLHSARIIPGQDGEVHAMFNALARAGAEVVYGRDAGIHASGHARRDELAQLLRLVRPKTFVPVHGEYTFLQAHAQLASSLGSDAPEDTLVIEDGHGLAWVPESTAPRPTRARREEPVTLTKHYSDDYVVADGEAFALQERKRIAWNGVVVLALELAPRVSDKGGWEATDIEVTSLALVDDAEGSLRHAVAGSCRAAVAGCPPGTPRSEMLESVRVTARRVVRRATGKKPEVVAVVRDALKPAEPRA